MIWASSLSGAGGAATVVPAPSSAAASRVLPKDFNFRRKASSVHRAKERCILPGATPSVAALLCWLRWQETHSTFDPAFCTLQDRPTPFARHVET